MSESNESNEDQATEALGSAANFTLGEPLRAAGAPSIDRVADLAREAIDLDFLAPEAEIGRLVPEGWRFEHIAPREHLLERPLRMRGAVALHDLDSLIAYVQQHERGDETTIWVDRKGRRVIGVINDHAGLDTAGWGDHRATLDLRATPEWEHWTRFDGQLLAQEEFADHIEEGMTSIVSPDGADLHELALTFHATSSGRVKSVIRQQDGTSNVEWDQETAAQAGVGGRLKIPEAIVLRMAPFVGEAEREIEAKLRYRAAGGSVKLATQLVRPHEHIDATLDAVTERLSEEFHRVLAGTPR